MDKFWLRCWVRKGKKEKGGLSGEVIDYETRWLEGGC